MQVDQELCNRYNQLTNVLSSISFLQLQSLSVKVEAAASAAAAAYRADVANFQQNLISLTGGVEQLRESMEQQGQQFQQELGLVLPQLEKMGVQIQLLSSFESKFDRIFDMMNSVAGYMQQLQQQHGHHEQQQLKGKKKVVPKPEMLILQDELKLLGCCLGEGTSGSLYTAKYGSEEVAVKTFFLKGATEDELKTVRILVFLGTYVILQGLIAIRVAQIEGVSMTTRNAIVVYKVISNDR
jgi:hypothetical protein